MSPSSRWRPRAGESLPLVMIGLLAVASGCMNQQLRFATARTTSTLPDLHYQQVMDNLALIAANPGFLPYLAVAGQGSIQVTNGGNAAFPASLAPGLSAWWLPSLGASRNVTGTWNLGTITSPEKIREMQWAYQNAVQNASRGSPSSGWLHAGTKRDVPRKACFVSHHGTVYVWVMPEGISGLSELALTILDIATREDVVQGPSQPRQPLRGAAGPPGVPRRNFQVPPAGPVFTPGTP
ncbi:MAG: hypothetical protein ACLQVF_22790 [Isosphaeraceae bacterium]